MWTIISFMGFLAILGYCTRRDTSQKQQARRDEYLATRPRPKSLTMQEIAALPPDKKPGANATY